MKNYKIKEIKIIEKSSYGVYTDYRYRVQKRFCLFFFKNLYFDDMWNSEVEFHSPIEAEVYIDNLKSEEIGK